MSRRLLLDVNVLLALISERHVHHDAAHERFADVDAWCTTTITELGLLRLLMTEPVMGQRVRAQDALDVVRAVRSAPGWEWVIDDTSPATWSLGEGVLRGRRQVTDLHLVSLAAVNDCLLATFDAGIPRSLHPSERRFVDVWR